MTDRPTDSVEALEAGVQQLLDDPDVDAESATPPDDGEAAEANGLAHLVLTVVDLLHEVLERQAIRRMENGSLSDDDIERIGEVLMRQSEELDRLCEEFDLQRDDLDIPLDGIRTIR